MWRLLTTLQAPIYQWKQDNCPVVEVKFVPEVVKRHIMHRPSELLSEWDEHVELTKKETLDKMKLPYVPPHKRKKKNLTSCDAEEEESGNEEDGREPVYKEKVIPEKWLAKLVVPKRIWKYCLALSLLQRCNTVVAATPPL